MGASAIREDWERINWLEQAAAELEIRIQRNEGVVFVHVGRVEIAGASLREALDAAMEATV